MSLLVCEALGSPDKSFAESVTFRDEISTQSLTFHLPIRDADSMLEKNSSKESDKSEPDHFGTRETKDRSLCTTGLATDKLSLNLFSLRFG